MTITLDDIKQIDFSSAFEISTGFDVQVEKFNDLSYISVNNFFKNPQKVIDTLKLFPSNNRDKFYENLKGKAKLLKPPGIQQFLPNNYFEGVSYILYKLLAEYDYVPYDFETTGDYAKLGSQITQFVYYTNIFYPKMPNYDNNYLPHFDQSRFAFNIYLSEDVGGGTSFYNLVHDGVEYSNINAIMKIDDYDTKKEIQDKLNSMNTVTETDPQYYSSFEENNLFKKYHTIPYEYNKLVLYPGIHWHTADYDSATETNVRYSLASTYTPSLESERE